MKVRVTSDALSDVQDSYDFYEKQAQSLGSYFRRCIEEDLEILRKTAGIHSKIRGYFHVNSKTFNSIFYYRIEQQAVVVMAILDARIDPDVRDRLLTQRG
jgi:plasmid stabilization system protein ParE